MPRVNLGISEREKETINAIREMFGGNYINLEQVAKFLGVTAETAKGIMQGTPCIKRGKTYRFAAQDVARTLSKLEGFA